MNLSLLIITTMVAVIPWLGRGLPGEGIDETALKTIGAPPRWKMAIVSFIGAYSISLLAQYILGLYLGQSPLLTNILMTIILVLGLTYFAMPLLSRLLRRWLYPRNV
ncbi:MAG: hypothetical protein WBF33_07455 [Candidatus Nitrosopolaris sp.]